MTQQNTFTRPDAGAIEEAIRRNRGNTAEIVLRLAWNAGLTRAEIHDLTWDRVDLENALLRLPGREVPIPEETAEVLREWKERFGGVSDYVAISARSKARMTGEAISALARHALDAVGQTEVRLGDLRHDYTLRQIETRGLPYALRVSGLTLGTYKNSLSKRYRSAGIDVRGIGAKKSPEERDRSDEEFRLWQIMQKEQDSAAGIALWLLQQMGLQVAAITRLTWDDVDFEAETLRAGGAARPMTRGAARVLRTERNRRQAEDDPHVILTARSRKPVSPERLGVMIREMLIRHGMDDVSALDLRMGMLRKNDWEILSAWVEDHGSIVPADAVRLLGLGYSAACQRLRTMAREGRLAHIGHKYYAAEKTPRPDKVKETIFRQIAEKGVISCGDAAKQLGIPPRRAGYLLRSMAAAGELSTPSRGKYAMPENTREAP